MGRIALQGTGADWKKSMIKNGKRKGGACEIEGSAAYPSSTVQRTSFQDVLQARIVNIFFFAVEPDLIGREIIAGRYCRPRMELGVRRKRNGAKGKKKKEVDDG